MGSTVSEMCHAIVFAESYDFVVSRNSDRSVHTEIRQDKCVSNEILNFEVLTAVLTEIQIFS